MPNFLRALLASLVIFAGAAFADDSVYYVYTGVANPPKYPDPQSACDAFFDYAPIEDRFKLPFLKREHEPYWRCQAGNSSGQTYQHGFVEVHSCPVDTVFNARTGECGPPEPPHQCETGDVIGPYKYSGYLSGGFVITDPEPPTSACKNGCEYSRKSKSSGCQTGHFGTFCSYEFVGVGVECTASPENDMGGDSGEGSNANEGGDGGDGSGDGGDGGDGGDDNHDDAQDDVPEAPETSTAEGDAKESTLQEVKSVLGTLSKESTTKKIETGINKGNTLLQGIKDAIGNISGGGNGSGDGDGDEDAESVAVVGSCSDALECSGDAIQCAMLQVQKNQLCAYQITPEVEQQIQSLFEAEENQLETKEIAVASVFTDGLNAARWLPSTCPVSESVTVFGRSYSISWQPLCTFASALSALIVAMASIFFIVYLGKGLKGS